MLPSDTDSKAVLHDAPPLDAPAAGAHGAASAMQLPRLGYKRCTACRQHRAIKGGTQKDRRFVCRVCLGLPSL